MPSVRSGCWCTGWPALPGARWWAARCARPFADVPFHPARAGLGLHRHHALRPRRCDGAAPLRPDLVEVHNRPEIALHLARRFRRVALFLHNDPHGMRGAATAAERTGCCGGWHGW